MERGGRGLAEEAEEHSGHQTEHAKQRDQAGDRVDGVPMMRALMPIMVMINTGAWPPGAKPAVTTCSGSRVSAVLGQQVGFFGGVVGFLRFWPRLLVPRQLARQVFPRDFNSTVTASASAASALLRLALASGFNLLRLAR